MQKLAKKLSLVMVALMTVFTALSYVPAKAATVVPQIQFAADQKTEFTAGERITFNLNAANYGGRVQYRVVLWNDTTKSYSDLWNTTDKYYTNWMPYGNETLPLGWVINQPGSYRITVYVKRAGIANNKTAIASANCDSYQAGPAFVVKPAAPAVDANYEAAVKAVAAYEAAPLTTLEQVTAAEALKAPATTAIAAVVDAAKKAELTAKVTAQDTKVAAAKTALTTVTVSKVATVDATTLKVTFDKDVTAAVKNFKIYEKDDTYAVQYVESVSVEKNVATVKLYDALSEDTKYVVEVNDVKSADGKAALAEKAVKEFEYVVAEPAKIEFKATTVTATSGTTHRYVKYVIYDKDGNDVTADFADASVTIESSDPSVVSDSDLEATLPAGKTTAYSVVNVKLDDFDLETGNKIVKVVNTQLKLTSLGRDTVSTGTFAKPVTYVYESDTNKTLNVEVLDQNGDVYNSATLTFKSNNPTIALVDQEDGTITPVSTGKATILVTATAGTTVVRKTYDVEVKADPEATSIKVDKTAVTLVRDSNIVPEVTVTVLDQYGKTFKGFDPADATDVVTYKIDKTGLVDGLVKYVSSDDATVYSDATMNADKTFTVALNPYVKTAGAYPADSIKGTGNVTFMYGDLKATVKVTVVDKAAFDGYAAVIDETKLDKNQATTGVNADYVDGAAKAVISVYEKDVNGNYINDITDDSRVEISDVAATKVVAVAADNSIVPYTGTGAKLGSEVVTVKVNDLKVASFTVTVVDTTRKITTVTQDNDVVEISLADGTTLEEALFGTDEDGAVFSAVDQYGKKIQITAADLTSVRTDNSNLIDTTVFDVQRPAAGADAVTGNATLTFKLAGNYYTIVVKVVE